MSDHVGGMFPTGATTFDRKDKVLARSTMEYGPGILRKLILTNGTRVAFSVTSTNWIAANRKTRPQTHHPVPYSQTTQF
ncbi:MAG: hypothetical protein CSA70_05830 [Rhodobacterales bacterium]|nr:MAG: hypothetical protein CSA70_05830 [Rhodobacterales bacterium]